MQLWTIQSPTLKISHYANSKISCLDYTLLVPLKSAWGLGFFSLPRNLDFITSEIIKCFHNLSMVLSFLYKRCLKLLWQKIRVGNSFLDNQLVLPLLFNGIFNNQKCICKQNWHWWKNEQRYYHAQFRITNEPKLIFNTIERQIYTFHRSVPFFSYHKQNKIMYLTTYTRVTSLVAMYIPLPSQYN